MIFSHIDSNIVWCCGIVDVSVMLQLLDHVLYMTCNQLAWKALVSCSIHSTWDRLVSFESNLILSRQAGACNFISYSDPVVSEVVFSSKNLQISACKMAQAVNTCCFKIGSMFGAVSQQAQQAGDGYKCSRSGYRRQPLQHCFYKPAQPLPLGTSSSIS